MTLIVAIEPDRRQANYLSAMVRGRLKAELVLADSADAAIGALGGRVPDVILTSALLSAKDETAVADWLRTLNTAAAHVQTLTIPVFAPSRPRPPQRVRGMFAALMGSDEEETAAPDGCDPAMFAEQCADYLERAQAERARNGEVFEAEHEVPEDHEVAEVVMQVMKPADAAVDTPPDEFVEFDLSRFLDTNPGRAEERTETPDAVSGRESAAAAAPANDIWIPPRLGVERLWPALEIPAAATRSAAAPPQAPARRVPRGRRPVQDEWGFFDPEQCGFAALLAKLREITEADDPPALTSD